MIVLRAAAIWLCFTTVGPAAAEPRAVDLLGSWSCEPVAAGEPFLWRVRGDLPGGWLTGEGFEAGRLTSLEAWAVEETGQLGVRRQFAPTGAFIELDVVTRGPNRLLSEGGARERDGTIVPLRHELTLLEPERLEARWLVGKDGDLTVVAHEICTQQPR